MPPRPEAPGLFVHMPALPSHSSGVPYELGKHIWMTIAENEAQYCTGRAGCGPISPDSPLAQPEGKAFCQVSCLFGGD